MASSGFRGLSPGLPGLPCWVDLVSVDSRASRDFYAALLGWTYERGARGYTMAFVGGIPVAGVYGPPADPWQPSAWTLYLMVHDAALAAARAQQLGGQIVVPPQDFAGQGELLLAADPSGAAIGLWQQKPDWEFGTGFPGAFTWAELNTWHGETADRFYQALFSFDQQQIGDGRNFDYTTWSLHGTEVLGRLRMGPEFPPDQTPHWMLYFAISGEVGADRTAQRAIRLGGRVSVQPFDSPYGRTAVIEDVTGAVFTVIDSTRRISVVPEEVIGAPVDDPSGD
jgi:uncharacterized protein